MNERTIELYKEACEFAYSICKEEGRPGGPADHIWHTLSTGRFAELIVRECMDVVDPGENQVIARYQARQWLSEHFGVDN